MSNPSHKATNPATLIQPVEYEPDTDSYRAFFDESTESVTMAVISVVATATDTDPTAIESLYSVIDFDALNTLMASEKSTPLGKNVQVTFTLEGQEVSVNSHGMIRVTPDTPTNW